MTDADGFRVARLSAGEIGRMRALLAVFGEAFEDFESYGAHQPDDAYLDGLLSSPWFYALIAETDGRTIGGLAAYELRKFEQPRSELYIYDLAVLASHRRRGVATALIEHLRTLARACGAYVVFVQADQGDEPAIALYDSLGTREEVLHFDIAPVPKP